MVELRHHRKRESLFSLNGGMGQLGRDRPALTIGGRQDVLLISSYTPTTHVEGSRHDINMHVAY